MMRWKSFYSPALFDKSQQKIILRGSGRQVAVCDEPSCRRYAANRRLPVRPGSRKAAGNYSAENDISVLCDESACSP
jgi:hypothetical protein